MWALFCLRVAGKELSVATIVVLFQARIVGKRLRKAKMSAYPCFSPEQPVSISEQLQCVLYFSSE